MRAVIRRGSVKFFDTADAGAFIWMRREGPFFDHVEELSVRRSEYSLAKFLFEDIAL